MYKNELKDLQGQVLPIFYGYYEAEMEDEELTGCLVTGYGGKHAEVPLNGLPWDMRKVQYAYSVTVSNVTNLSYLSS